MLKDFTLEGERRVSTKSSISPFSPNNRNTLVYLVTSILLKVKASLNCLAVAHGIRYVEKDCLSINFLKIIIKMIHGNALSINISCPPNLFNMTPVA